MHEPEFPPNPRFTAALSIDKILKQVSGSAPLLFCQSSPVKSLSINQNKHIAEKYITAHETLEATSEGNEIINIGGSIHSQV